LRANRGVTQDPAFKATASGQDVLRAGNGIALFDRQMCVQETTHSMTSRIDRNRAHHGLKWFFKRS
jgi:hypothetical protein